MPTGTDVLGDKKSVPLCTEIRVEILTLVGHF